MTPPICAGTKTTVKGPFIDEVITLADNALQNASQEFIAETIFHETIHAYLNVNTTIKNEMLQHCEMIFSYADCEVAALQDIFPGLSPTDAISLVLGGMGQVQEYDPATMAIVYAHYGLTQNQIASINSSYQSGSVGISCFGVH